MPAPVVRTPAARDADAVRRRPPQQMPSDFEAGNERRRDWRRDGQLGTTPNVGSARQPFSNEAWRKRHWSRPRPSYRILPPSSRYHYHPYWWGRNIYLFDNRYRGYGYDYGAYYRPGYGYYGGQLGSGWAVLYPWLRQDPATRHWVLWTFDDNRNGRLGKEEAREANRAFDRLADRNDDGYVSERERRWAVDELRDEYRYSYRYG